ncbi:hypothetical protein [Atlantibacter hermannii]|uniref:hypothetical protein n=1 Tax=Atlantibacter hermannii TaxID=565 RepID=UPI0028A58A49|nr:hypothetical protein [Atlantibacter hermannii]
MFVISSDIVPEGMKLVKIHGLIEYTHGIELSGKNQIGDIKDFNESEFYEAYKIFINSAWDGNAIFGVKISTSTVVFNNKIHFYKTYYGTLATIERR